MYLSAYIRHKETKEYSVMTHEDYNTKDSFRKDLISNGYTVIRISNKRDLAAQDHNYPTFLELKKSYSEFIKQDPILWKNEKELIEEIESIEL